MTGPGARRGDVPTLCLYQGLRNREADPRAAMRPIAGAVNPVEAFENVRQVLRRNAVSGVCDVDLDVTGVLWRSGPQRDAAAGSGVIDRCPEARILEPAIRMMESSTITICVVSSMPPPTNAFKLESIPQDISVASNTVRQSIFRFIC